VAGSFRQRALRVLVEVVSVVFAVLVALAVDEVRQDHAERKQAQEARAAVLTELASNLGELRRTEPGLDSLTARLDAIDEAVARGTHPPPSALDLELPDFSRAAWETAQMTQATAHLPLDWLILVSKAYETQALYESLRTDVIRTFGSVGEEGVSGALPRLASQLHVLQEVSRGLEQKYDSIFASSGSGPSTPDTAVSGGAPVRDTIRTRDTVPPSGGTQ
jgi:hypothetical protein